MPIVVASYDGDRATLLSTCPGQHALITVDGISGVTIENLVLSANNTQTALGVLVQNGNAGNVADTIVVRHNDISGFNISGATHYGAEVFVAGRATNGNCGSLRNVQILDNKLHGAAGAMSPDDNGITGFGCGQNITNVKYSGNEIYHIGGHAPAPGGTSGNGIVAANVLGAELSFNLVHDNGANAKTCGGPAGVWAYRSSGVTISFNEVYRMRPLPAYPAGACDWAAYDLDVGVTGSVVEFNYSHDNAGPALLAYTKDTWGPNSFRFNISENDQGAMVGGSGAIAIDSGGTSYVYNNTVYRAGNYAGTTPPSCISLGPSGVFPKGTLIANNICVNAMTDRFGATSYIDSGEADVSAVIVSHNLYYNPLGHDRWHWLKVEYSSLDAFQAAAGKDEKSIVGDPLLTNPGGGDICGWTSPQRRGPQPCPRAYQLGRGSPAIGAGADVAAPVSTSLPAATRDYYGHALPPVGGKAHNIGADGAAPF